MWQIKKPWTLKLVTTGRELQPIAPTTEVCDAVCDCSFELWFWETPHLNCCNDETCDNICFWEIHPCHPCLVLWRLAWPCHKHYLTPCPVSLWINENHFVRDRMAASSVRPGWFEQPAPWQQPLQPIRDTNRDVPDPQFSNMDRGKRRGRGRRVGYSAIKRNISNNDATQICSFMFLSHHSCSLSSTALKAVSEVQFLNCYT